ncbi:MAG TPA: lysophospholipase [candidate division Zixibacteria bacterium]|nr:lysophospholipase [candidate division Zixibacteria bacterium]
MTNINFTFTDHIGIDIFVNKWVPDDNIPLKGMLCIFHGMAEHSFRYDYFAKEIGKAGYICYACDIRGHGKSIGKDGVKGSLGSDGWDGVILDFKQLIDIMKKDFPNLPIFLFGHSWGSAIVQDFIQQYSEMLNGVILSGSFGTQPFLKISIPLAKMIIKIKGKDREAGLAYNLAIEPFNKPYKKTKIRNAWISTLPEVVSAYNADPMCGFRPTNGFFYESSKALKRFWNSETKIPKDLPIFIIRGIEDQVNKCGKWLTPLLDRYKKLGLKNVTYKIYPNVRHETLNDTSREEVIADILSFFDKHIK